ncbi:MAG TPA: GNAT family N-acetyltransferase [Synechococcales cyanobacterium M55_K2018_004]|nr:GNAT family N-acetyltransferase [Synechococcales cyanobacterium M55_K2018_004]
MKLQVLEPAHPLWVETVRTLRHDIFHLPQYVSLEAKRCGATPEAILLEEGDCIFFLPYLLRHCNDVADGEAIPDLFDVVSPNGYAGILLNQAALEQPEFISAAMEQIIQFFGDRRICSAFLRLHPIINQGFHEIYSSEACTANVETVMIDLTPSETEMQKQIRHGFREVIKKRKREGYVTKMQSLLGYVDVFNSIYEETMDRVGAAKSFYFGHDYFYQLAEELGEHLHLGVVELEGQVICVALYTECCGIVQYHLSGTKTEFVRQSPSVLLNDYVRFWAKERGNKVMHLGGGVGGAKDSLFHFKAGFSPLTCRLPVLRLITNPQEYRRLVELHAQGLRTSVEQLVETNFFPAYRSPLRV